MSSIFYVRLRAIFDRGLSQVQRPLNGHVIMIIILGQSSKAAYRVYVDSVNSSAPPGHRGSPRSCPAALTLAPVPTSQSKGDHTDANLPPDDPSVSTFFVEPSLLSPLFRVGTVDETVRMKKEGQRSEIACRTLQPPRLNPPSALPRWP